MTTFHSLTLSTTVFALLLGMSSPLAQAADAPNASDDATINMSAVQLVPQQQNGITYLSGGIGIDETQAIQQTRGYNLHLTFSTGPSNEYIPNIDVQVKTLKGDTVLSMNQVGPIAYVKLPANKYQVVSSRDGQEKRQTIEVNGNSVRTVNFHWNDMP